MGLFYLFFVSSCRPLEVSQPYTSIQEEKLGDMDDVMFIIWNTLHVFLATLYIRIGKRLWAFRLKGWHGLLLGVFFCLLIALVLRLVAIDRWVWLDCLSRETCC